MLKIDKQKYTFLESLNKTLNLHRKNLEKTTWAQLKSDDFQVTLKKGKEINSKSQKSGQKRLIIISTGEWCESIGECNW